MSGLSQNSLAELSSDRNYDRIPHFCNMLRFAVLKKNSSLMAIGGPWDPVDGGDPSTDDSSLIRTALRYAKDVTDLDLKNCQHWNRFLEIHYMRVGKDGLFSHKEVTVLFVPDLSDCLPSLDSWKDQWINQKNAVSERERKRYLKNETPEDKKEGLKEKKKLEDVKDAKSKNESQKKKEISSSGQAAEVNKKDIDVNKLKGKGNSSSENEGAEEAKAAENKDGIQPAKENEVTEQVKVESASVQAGSTAKPGKRKTIKRIVKKKVVNDKGSAENSAKPNDKPAEEGVTDKNIIPEVADQQGSLSSTPPPPSVKTFTRKKIVKKPENSVQGAVESSIRDAKASNPDSVEDKSMVITDGTNDAMVQDGTTKTTVKKKVIKKVLKRKAVSAAASKAPTDDMKGDTEVVKPQIDALAKEEIKEPVTDKKEENSLDKKNLSESEKVDSNKQKDAQNDNSVKSEGKEELKDEKVRKTHAGKDESVSKAAKEVKEKKKVEEPPRHPGLFLQTKGSKDSKIHSLSLSLDSLLDYTDKDIEESTFELSLFAESLYEMLQYKMGCRLLTFLQELRLQFVRKRNQRKRPREETSKKENEEKLSKKRAKEDESNENNVSNKTDAQKNSQANDSNNIIKTHIQKNSQTNDSNNVIKEEITPPEQLDAKPQAEPEEDDPEEDPEEDEEIPNASPHHDSTKENVVEDGKNDTDAKSENVKGEEKEKEQDKGKQPPETQTIPEKSNEDKVTKVESKTKDTQVVVDKRLLQAFRFFDRNRVGYIRVEDLRLIIHNLGKFLSHRDVKGLVQSSLLESNTGRDDKILYDKLVKSSKN